jgi:hypothetical protein
MVSFPALANNLGHSSRGAKEFRNDSEGIFVLRVPQAETERSFSPMVKKLLILTAAVAVTAGLASAECIRAGVFDKQAVVVAFYRSPQWAEVNKAKIAELDAAKKANDTVKVKTLQAWGTAHQELAHQQLTGEAPIGNILEALAPGLADIARRAGVNFIAADLAFADPAVNAFDVTDFLMAFLHADSRTLSLVHDLRKRRH